MLHRAATSCQGGLLAAAEQQNQSVYDQRTTQSEV
jgi:hypothetical protein